LSCSHLKEAERGGVYNHDSNLDYTRSSNDSFVRGSADIVGIRLILKNNINIFKSCYYDDFGEKKKGHVTGLIRFYFKINPDGFVDDPVIDKRIKITEDIRSCLISVLNELTFPKPIEGETVEVNQIFDFKPYRL
jgi:hypothetical protein